MTHNTYIYVCVIYIHMINPRTRTVWIASVSLVAVNHRCRAAARSAARNEPKLANYAGLERSGVDYSGLIGMPHPQPCDGLCFRQKATANEKSKEKHFVIYKKKMKNKKTKNKCSFIFTFSH